jgi:hypothetical protein
MSVTARAGSVALMLWVAPHRVPPIPFPGPRLRATDVSPHPRASLGGTAWTASSGQHGSLAMPGTPWHTKRSIRSLP